MLFFQNFQVFDLQAIFLICMSREHFLSKLYISSFIEILSLTFRVPLILCVFCFSAPRPILLASGCIVCKYQKQSESSRELSSQRITQSVNHSILKGKKCSVNIHSADQSIDLLLNLSINAAYIFITENSKILFISVKNFVQCSKVFVTFDTKDYPPVIVGTGSHI